MDKYLARVLSVVNAVAPLGDRKCWALYIALLDNDEGLRFNQLKEVFRAESPEVSRSLKSLANAGLITKRARCLSDVGNSKVSYYVPTALGKNLIKSLYKGLLPVKPPGLGQVTSSGTGYPEIGGSNTQTSWADIDEGPNYSTGGLSGAPRCYSPVPCQPHGSVSYGSS